MPTNKQIMRGVRTCADMTVDEIIALHPKKKPPRMTPADLRRAARLLVLAARDIKYCNTTKSGRWDDERDKADYDEHMRLTRALYKEARKP